MNGLGLTYSWEIVGAEVGGNPKPGTVQKRRELVHKRKYLDKSFIKSRFVSKLEGAL